MISREQAIGLGLTRHSVGRLVDTGSWQRLIPGMFLVAGGPPCWQSWAWAAVLQGGPGARLTGVGAAFAHRLVDQAPPELVVLIPADRGPLRPQHGEISWRFRRETTGLRDRRTVGSPPAVTVEDAVLDLVSAAARPEDVVGWVTAAVQRRSTTPARLRSAAARRPALRHRRLFDQLVDDVSAGAQSALELRYLRDVERAHGLPAGVRQVRRRGTRADVLYADYGLLVELDGRLGHVGEGAFRDMRRDNSATTDGLATLRYGWSDVTGSGCLVARQVAHTLQLRGWPGPLLPCRLCGRVPDRVLTG